MEKRSSSGSVPMSWRTSVVFPAPVVPRRSTRRYPSGSDEGSRIIASRSTSKSVGSGTMLSKKMSTIRGSKRRSASVTSAGLMVFCVGEELVKLISQRFGFNAVPSAQSPTDPDPELARGRVQPYGMSEDNRVTRPTLGPAQARRIGLVRYDGCLLRLLFLCCTAPDGDCQVKKNNMGTTTRYKRMYLVVEPLRR